MPTPTRPPKIGKIAITRVSVAAAVAATLAFTAACSSTKSASGSSASNAPATISAGVANAEAAVAEYMKVPTSLGLSTPLKSRPTGGTFVFLGCELGPCKIVGDGIQEAAKAAGLTYKLLPISAADPATLISGMKQALQMSPKPIAVGFAAFPEAVWASMIPQFQAAGVTIVPDGVGVVSPSPVVPSGSLNGPDDIKKQTDALANYFVVNSNGNGKALLLNIPEVGAFAPIKDEFSSTVSGLCSSCKVKSIDITLSQLGSNSVVPAVVSALQRDPSINYVVTPLGDAVGGFAAAAAAAGLPKVKVLALTPSISTEQGILDGTVEASVALPLKITGWKMVDTALRAQQKMPVAPADGGMPVQLFTKQNLTTPAATHDNPADYQHEFESLWGLG